MNRLKQIAKKINILKVLEILAASFAVLVPTVGFAALGLNPGDCTGLGGGINCTGATSVTGLLKLVISWLLALAGLIAVLFLIIGGFWYLTSAGNEEQAEKGKNTVINAIIGIVIIVLSWVIVNVVANLAANTGTQGAGSGL